MPLVRFAPSPTGLLHLGHAYSAWFTQDQAKGDECLLRFEDIDIGRCRPEFYDAVLEDLAWLGIRWSSMPIKQSDRRDIYDRALDQLRDADLLYPCFCTRAQILQEEERIGAAPHGPTGARYPGTCRTLSTADSAVRIEAGEPHAWRLNTQKAAKHLPPLTWSDLTLGEQQVDTGQIDDVVLARKDSGLSYHLCCVVDDHDQQIELITRGIDLVDSTPIHRVLQELLKYDKPEYDHHLLVVDEQGRRLAKRHDDLSIAELRSSGLTAEDVIRLSHQRLSASAT